MKLMITYIEAKLNFVVHDEPLSYSVILLP